MDNQADLLNQLGIPIPDPNEVIVDDFMTDPLAGMMHKPAHLYTEAELDDFVARTRQMRNSTQMMKAAMQEDVAKVKVAKEKTAKVVVTSVNKAALDDLMNL